MGMFDYVRSEIPLPDGFTGELQSKDFDCALTNIVISADGRLLIEDFEYEEVPKEERSFPDAPDDDILSIVGALRRVNRRWRDLDHHGDFNFYGYAGQYGNPGYNWHEYVARFTNGKLEFIRIVEDRHAG